jgi:hypothetical protein
MQYNGDSKYPYELLVLPFKYRGVKTSHWDNVGAKMASTASLKYRRLKFPTREKHFSVVHALTYGSNS